jgi:16S rRNA G1207 methylase RsmC
MDMNDFFMREYMALSMRSANAHVVITDVDGSKRAVRDALANLEEHHPEEAALLQEHADTGKSTDSRWKD